jgi:hypothetical protein
MPTPEPPACSARHVTVLPPTTEPPAWKARAAAPPTSQPLPSAATGYALWVFALNNLVTPLSTQAYAPVLPLFVTDALGLPVVVAGLFVAALAAGSLCSHMLVARLLKYNSVRFVLLVAHLVRTLAAILYVAAVVYRNDVRRASALLLSSRLLHGLTLNTSALPVRAQAAGC